MDIKYLTKIVGGQDGAVWGDYLFRFGPDGVYDERFGVNTVTLSVSDMTGYFDCEYHRFIQGACTHNGKIYSLEGFTNDVKNPPALRVICPENNRQEIYIPFSDFGLAVEPEFIDFKDDVCYYADLSGKLYTIDF